MCDLGAGFPQKLALPHKYHTFKLSLLMMESYKCTVCMYNNIRHIEFAFVLSGFTPAQQ